MFMRHQRGGTPSSTYCRFCRIVQPAEMLGTHTSNCRLNPNRGSRPAADTGRPSTVVPIATERRPSPGKVSVLPKCFHCGEFFERKRLGEHSRTCAKNPGKRKCKQCRRKLLVRNFDRHSKQCLVKSPKSNSVWAIPGACRPWGKSASQSSLGPEHA